MNKQINKGLSRPKETEEEHQETMKKPKTYIRLNCPVSRLSHGRKECELLFTRRGLLGTKESRGDGNSHKLTEILGDWKGKKFVGSSHWKQSFLPCILILAASLLQFCLSQPSWKHNFRPEIQQPKVSIVLEFLGSSDLSPYTCGENQFACILGKR